MTPLKKKMPSGRGTMNMTNVSSLSLSVSCIPTPVSSSTRPHSSYATSSTTNPTTNPNPTTDNNNNNNNNNNNSPISPTTSSVYSSLSSSASTSSKIRPSSSLRSTRTKTVYVPEGIVLLSPFNNIAKLQDRLRHFLVHDYEKFRNAPADEQPSILRSLLAQDRSSSEERRFSASLSYALDSAVSSPEPLLSHSSIQYAPQFHLSTSPHEVEENLMQPTTASEVFSVRNALPCSTEMVINTLKLHPTAGHMSAPSSPRLPVRTAPSPLRLLLSTLSLRNILLIQRLLLLEYSVLCVSSQYGLLMMVMEGLKECMYVIDVVNMYIYILIGWLIG